MQLVKRSKLRWCWAIFVSPARGEVGSRSQCLFGNVEHAAAKVVGRETLQYVSSIYKYDVAYRLARERATERGQAKQGAAEDR
jgi:hypothetical protein